MGALTDLFRFHTSKKTKTNFHATLGSFHTSGLIRFAVFQADPIGPPTVLYGEVDANGHVCLLPAESDQPNTDGWGTVPSSVLMANLVVPKHLICHHWSSGLDDSQMETDRRSVSIRHPHREQLGSADRSSAEQVDPLDGVHPM